MSTLQAVDTASPKGRHGLTQGSTREVLSQHHLGMVTFTLIWDTPVSRRLGRMEVAVATVELTAENFDDQVTSAEIALVDFWAKWCAPCRLFAPVFERVAAHHPDIVFGKVDTETQHELADMFEVSSVPTLVVIRDKIVLYARPGPLSEPELDKVVTRARAIDMDRIRRTVDTRRTGWPTH